MKTELNRILYVEDEEDIQIVGKMALEAGNFTIEVCSSGDEALKKAASFSPDLIILDVMMPGMDGPATFQELRKIKQTKTTPVIFMTAKVQPSEVEEYKKLGVVGVIAKPFDPMTLVETVRNLWSQHYG